MNVDTKSERHYTYPNEPIGRGNPYWCCSACGRSDPEINGRLDGHYDWCKWMIEKKKEMGIK